MNRRVSFLGVAIIATGLASDVRAQTTGSFTDVPDHFRLEVGGFHLGSDTNLNLNGGTGGGSDVGFEKDLAVPGNSTRLYFEGYWRVGRRHELSAGFFRNGREGPTKVLSRDVPWGDHVFTAGAQVQGKASSSYFSAVYRFAAYKNDRFEIGPAIGLGHLSVEASIATTLGLSGSGGSTSEDFERSVSRGQITGDLGGYLYWWPAKRVLVRGDARYILVKPEKAEASITDVRAAVLYHPWPKVGAGLQYIYTKFRYDRDLLSRDLGGSLRYSGGQFLVSFAF